MLEACNTKYIFTTPSLVPKVKESIEGLEHIQVNICTYKKFKGALLRCMLPVQNKSTAKRGNIRPPLTTLQGYPIYIAGQRRKIGRLLQMSARYVAIWLLSYGVKKDADLVERK